MLLCIRKKNAIMNENIRLDQEKEECSMVHIIMGPEGSGKTKMLIDAIRL